jgi:hypothetical protein
MPERKETLLAVARKLVAHLMAVDRGQQDLVPAAHRIGPPPKPKNPVSRSR